jgi:hypothetical protein
MQTPSQRTRMLLTVAVFSLAGYLSAQVYISYSSWVDALIKANDTAALHKYSADNVLIFLFEFPVALTLAMLVAKSAGWLGHVNLWQGAAGLMPVYLVPGAVIFLSSITFFALTIPCLAVAALVLALSLKFITSRWSSKLFLGFLISGAISVVFWFLVGIGPAKNNMDMAWSTFFISLHVMWAGIFGMGLAAPPNARLQQARNGVPLISTQPRSN